MSAGFSSSQSTRRFVSANVSCLIARMALMVAVRFQAAAVLARPQAADEVHVVAVLLDPLPNPGPPAAVVGGGVLERHPPQCCAADQYREGSESYGDESVRKVIFSIYKRSPVRDSLNTATGIDLFKAETGTGTGLEAAYPSAAELREDLAAGFACGLSGAEENTDRDWAVGAGHASITWLEEVLGLDIGALVEQDYGHLAGHAFLQTTDKMCLPGRL
ncbi:hypothetical protein VTK56DRAFT_2071 [Thermocarpiscus australiensis]